MPARKSRQPDRRRSAGARGAGDPGSFKSRFLDGPARFAGEVAIVTGAARGIGRAIAERFAREGATVYIADIDKKEAEDVARSITNEGSVARAIECDVTRPAQIENLVRAVITTHDRIDILAYVAGVGEARPFIRTDEALWDRTLDVNLRGAFLFARAVVPHMIRQRRGKLVFMASTNAWDAEAELAPYNVSKAGLFLLAKTLARELGHFGICSNAIGPGLIRTRLTAPMLRDPEFMKKYENLIPAGRIGDPEDIAGPAAFLASRDADYVNGVLLFVDGGQLA